MELTKPELRNRRYKNPKALFFAFSTLLLVPYSVVQLATKKKAQKHQKNKRKGEFALQGNILIEGLSSDTMLINLKGKEWSQSGM